MNKKEQVKKIIAANVLLKGTPVFPFDFSVVADEIDALYSNPPSPEMVKPKHEDGCIFHEMKVEDCPACYPSCLNKIN
jgi:hypothetical protein